MFISNNGPSFHFWWKEKLVKHQKASEYYETDCRYLSLILVSLLGTCIWGTPCLFSWVLCYSIKNPNRRGGLRIYMLCWKTPRNLQIFHFSLRKQAFTAGYSTKTVLHTLKIPRPMENLNDFFLINPGKSTSFLLEPKFYACSFLVPLEISCPQIPPNFFWNSALIENMFGLHHFIRN